MRNTLVVGANSFIGQHLIDRLIKRGDHVTGLVRSFKKGSPNWDKDVRIIQGDITEKRSLSGMCKDISVVFHLAAKVHDFSTESQTAEEHFAVNVQGTRNILDECANSGIEHFVYFSSVKAMAEESADHLDETSAPSPATPYGKSKLAAEKLVAEYGKKYGFKTTSVRLPLVYGPGNKGNIYRMIEAVDKGRFIMMGRGESRRSMVYVGNVTDAALAVTDSPEADGKVFIVTDGIDYTVRELYEIISKGLSKRPLPFYIPMSIAKGLALVGDAAGVIVRRPLLFNTEALEKLTSIFTFSSMKIHKEIGFKPQYNLHNTIDETVRWYKSVMS